MFFEIFKTSDILSVVFWDGKKTPKKRQESQARWPSTLATSVCWSKCFTWKLRRPWSPALRVLTCEISVGPGWSNASWSVWSLLKPQKPKKKLTIPNQWQALRSLSFLVQKNTPHIWHPLPFSHPDFNFAKVLVQSTFLAKFDAL